MALHFDALTAKALAIGLSGAAHVALVFALPISISPGASPAAAAPVEVQVDYAPAPEPDHAPLENRVTRPKQIETPRAEPTPAAAPRAMVPVVFPADLPKPLATAQAIPTFTIAVSAGAAGVHEVTSSPSSPSTLAGDPADDVDAPEESVDVPASLARGELPTYPEGARDRNVEADVGLELVVSREGTVESARGLRRVGFGLDEAALEAARKFRFTPATKRGRAVRVRVRWTVEFRLR